MNIISKIIHFPSSLLPVLPLLTALILLGTPAGSDGGLKDIWGPVIKKYPVPTQEEVDSLTWAYEQLARYSAEKFEPRVDPEIDRPPETPVETVRKIYHKRLEPFRALIAEAAKRYDVPQEIIGAVILQESSGRPKAKAKTSSAKGLMQTIDDTFALARGHVKKCCGVTISDPYDPHDSINAGTWYLSYMFELAKKSFPSYSDRSKPVQWKKALEFYYAGPKWGKDPNKIVVVKIGKKTIRIKKDWYANKVLKRVPAVKGEKAKGK